MQYSTAAKSGSFEIPLGHKSHLNIKCPPPGLQHPGFGSQPVDVLEAVEPFQDLAGGSRFPGKTIAGAASSCFRRTMMELPLARMLPHPCLSHHDGLQSS